MHYCDEILVMKVLFVCFCKPTFLADEDNTETMTY